MTARLRLLRIDVRRNTMPWLLPVIVLLFWLVVYRRALDLPPRWSVRAMAMQTATVSVFVPVVVGAAAWLGGREARHGLSELLATTSRSRWSRQAATWAATTGWAMLAYAVCEAAFYVTTAQKAWGGPLWWPAAVVAASVPAFTALGFAAGALRPSRFTAPLAALAAFFALEFAAQLIHGQDSMWQISPLVAGPWNSGPEADVAVFYHYLSDLPRLQIAFLIGGTAVLLGMLGLPREAGSRAQRGSAALLTAAGLAVASTAVLLAGTGRLDPHGMIAIPAVHHAAEDQPVAYTPVCDGSPIPVCLHPAYAYALPTVTAALQPVLGQLNGVPGAPVRIEQTTAVYSGDGDNGIDLRVAGPQLGGDPVVYRLLLPNQVPGPTLTLEATATALRTQTARSIATAVLAGSRDLTPAQQAVIEAVTGTGDAAPNSPQGQAAQRFAALPADRRHSWLVDNAAALRAGRITLEQLP